MWPSCSMKTPTMTSRLPERRLPDGRCRSTNSVGDSMADGRAKAGLRRALELRAERGPAAAGGLGVRVLDRESAAHVVVDEIDLGVPEVAEADRIDEQPDTVDFEHLV